MIPKIIKSIKIIFRSLQIALTLVWSRAEMYCTLTGEISGKDGTLKTGNTTYGSATEVKIKNWKFTRTGNAINVPDSSVTDGGMPKLPGKYIDSKGTFDALFRYGDTPLSPNTIYDAHFVLDDTTDDEMYYSGSIIVTEMGVETPIDDNGAAVAISYAFEVDGVLALTDNSQS